MITLLITPAGFTPHAGRQLWTVSVDGGPALGIYEQPFLDSARALQALGYPDEEELAMRHVDSETIALRCTVGAAARLTVHERKSGGLPRFAEYRAYDPAQIAKLTRPGSSEPPATPQSVAI